MTVNEISPNATPAKPTERRGSMVRDWLPSRGQLLSALQLEPAYPIIPDLDAPLPAHSLAATSMRQGMGLVVLAALLAGLIPFLFTWVIALQAGSAAQLARAAAEMDLGADLADGSLVRLVLSDAVNAMVALEPAGLPGWLAATLTALGEWLEWPLRWLAVWIVYGLGVLGTLKLLGATTTLQRYYAISAYAALPLILVGIGGRFPVWDHWPGLVGYVWGVDDFAAHPARRNRTDNGSGVDRRGRAGSAGAAGEFRGGRGRGCFVGACALIDSWVRCQLSFRPHAESRSGTVLKGKVCHTWLDILYRRGLRKMTPSGGRSTGAE
ncbi:MAG: hypothetical protein HC802_10235 [Caldilineaceae bacterium]|nr:hypothetical protein [Caldilineaceae bacterium]